MWVGRSTTGMTRRQACLELRHEGPVGLGVEERLAGDAIGVESEGRDHHDRRAAAMLQAASDLRATSTISRSFSRTSVICGLWRTRVRSRYWAGTVWGSLKTSTSTAPGQITCGSPSRPAVVRRSAPPASRAWIHLVGDLDDREVEHGADDPFLHHVFHRPAAGPDRVEDDRLVAGPLEDLDGLHRPGRGDADGGDGDERLVAAADGHVDVRHAAGGGRGVGQDLPHEPIQAHDVGHREHHGDVLVSTQGATFPDAMVETITLGKP